MLRRSLPLPSKSVGAVVDLRFADRRQQTVLKRLRYPRPAPPGSWILLDFEFHIMVEVGKPGRDCAPRPSTAHHQDPYPTTKKFSVNSVSLHDSLTLAALDKLPQGLSRVRQELSRKPSFAVRQAKPQAGESLGVRG
jgi:hypothetical protein